MFIYFVICLNNYNKTINKSVDFGLIIKIICMFWDRCPFAFEI